MLSVEPCERQFVNSALSRSFIEKCEPVNLPDPLMIRERISILSKTSSVSYEDIKMCAFEYGDEEWKFMMSVMKH